MPTRTATPAHNNTSERRRIRGPLRRLDVDMMAVQIKGEQQGTRQMRLAVAHLA